MLYENGWRCSFNSAVIPSACFNCSDSRSIAFDGKTNAPHNANICLFLEDWEEQRGEIRSYAHTQSQYAKWNPCHKAGVMGKKKADDMLFWTKEEFLRFAVAVKDKPASYAMFMTMYYTGVRVGELLALTPSDVDLDKLTLTGRKNYQRIRGQDIITTPKTPKSNRVITIPQRLAGCLKDYEAMCYGLDPVDRLFLYTMHFLHHEMERGCKKSFVVANL